MKILAAHFHANIKISEEIIEACIQNANSIEQFRYTAGVMPNINDILFVYINIFDVKNQLISIRTNLKILEVILTINQIFLI